MTLRAPLLASLVIAPFAIVCAAMLGACDVEGVTPNCTANGSDCLTPPGVFVGTGGAAGDTGSGGTNGVSGSGGSAMGGASGSAGRGGNGGAAGSAGASGSAGTAGTGGAAGNAGDSGTAVDAGTDGIASDANRDSGSVLDASVLDVLTGVDVRAQ